MNKVFLASLFLMLIALPSSAQRFGNAITVSGDQIIAGDGESQVHAGITYLFSMADKAQVSAESHLYSDVDASSRDGFGASTYADEDLLLVGSSFGEKVFSFKRDGQNNWIPGHEIVGDYRGFGSVVTMAGAFVAVASPAADSVSIYVHTDTGFEHQQDIAAPESGINFGTAMQFVGTDLFVGAPQAGNGAGSVYVYSRSESGSWEPHTDETLRNRYVEEGTLKGSALASNGHLLAVGAPGFDRNTGTVLLFAKVNPAYISRHSVSFQSI